MGKLGVSARSVVGSAILLAACSSNSGGATGVTASQAAADAASALCTRYEACSAFFIQLEYGDVASCTSSVTQTLTNALAASGTGATPSQVEDCAKAVPSASCDDTIGHNLPSECQPVKGQLSTGTACGDSSQCATAYCHTGPNSTCGACAATPTTSASCNADADCPPGDVCSKAGTCASPGAAGASCDPMQSPCKPTLACKSGACAAPDAAGASCTKTTDATGATVSDTCDALAGLYCSAAGTCVAIALVSAGQPCLLVDKSLTLCTGSGVCNVPSMLATTGTCLAAAAPGATCAPESAAGAYAYSVTSPDCSPPAVCENSVCTIPDSGSCH